MCWSEHNVYIKNVYYEKVLSPTYTTSEFLGVELIL